MTTTTAVLTIDQTDAIVLAASQPQDGAIEDCEETDATVAYFFESGSTITVCRITGTVSR